jgi:hypothetical protein
VLERLAAHPRDAVPFAQHSLKDLPFAWELARSLDLDDDRTWSTSSSPTCGRATVVARGCNRSSIGPVCPDVRLGRSVARVPHAGESTTCGQLPSLEIPTPSSR